MSMQSRLNLPAPEEMREDQRVVLEDILATRGNLDGPFLAWTLSPGLANPAQQLGAFCRYHTQLDLVESELAILTTAAWWRSQAMARYCYSGGRGLWQDTCRCCTCRWRSRRRCTVVNSTRWAAGVGRLLLLLLLVSL